MFERFTTEARRAVVLSQEEARRLGHGQIGTEHLLLALLHAADTQASGALREAGVGLEPVRNEIERIEPAGPPRPRGHLPFTPRSKKVLELALRESIQLRHRTIEPEHILLGLLREGQGLAVQVLVTLGTDLEALRDDVVRRLGPPTKGRFFGTGHPELGQMTRAGAAAFDRARTLAGDKPVASHHLLLGLFGDEESVAKRALNELGVTAGALQEKLAQIDPADTADEAPERAGARRTRLQVAGDVVTMRVQDADLAARLSTSLRRWRRPSGETVELSGTEPEVVEPFARLWRAVHTTSDEILQRVSGSAAGSADWNPPGWPTRVSVAAYAVSSRPDGPRAELFPAEGIDEGAVRAWLAKWLEGQSAFQEAECVYFAVVVGRVGDAVPNALAPDQWTISSFAAGADPAPADWPRLPLPELVSFAVDDLRGAAAASG